MLACTLYIIHQNRESNFSSIPQSFYLFPHLILLLYDRKLESSNLSNKLSQ